MNRRNFLKGSAVFGGAVAALGPFQAVSARRALGAAIAKNEGYGPLVNKGDLWRPCDFPIHDRGMVISRLPNIRASSENAPGPRNAIAIDRTIRLMIAG